MRSIAIVPARSGSRGLPGKNVMPLHGKPLLVWTIVAALASGEFAEVMVSTDSEEYALIAKQAGASVPFLRSVGASTDEAGSWDVVAEVLESYEATGERFDTVCLLQPTSPLRTADDICGAYELYRERDAAAVISVCEAEHSPLWCTKLTGDCKIDGFLSGSLPSRRQECEAYYRLNGAIYIVDASRFVKSGFNYDEDCYAYIMASENSVDIDTEYDFKTAEFILGERLASELKLNNAD